MRKFMAASWMALLISLALIAILGCNAKPYDYQPAAGEMKQGPGVLTGEDGELTIYDSKKGGAFPRDSDVQEAGTSGEKTASPTAAAGTAAAGSQGQAGEFQEFQEYQQWQKEKEQFHQYQQWKKSTAGSADYKEFQEYQQWQKSAKGSSDFKDFQAYQQWKKSGKSSADYKEYQ
jgi:hypothetical protein